MYSNSPLPTTVEELKSQLCYRLNWEIRMSRLVALRATKRYPNRKQCIAEVQLRQLIGSIGTLILELDTDK